MPTRFVIEVKSRTGQLPHELKICFQSPKEPGRVLNEYVTEGIYRPIEIVENEALKGFVVYCAYEDIYQVYAALRYVRRVLRNPQKKEPKVIEKFYKRLNSKILADFYQSMGRECNTIENGDENE